MANLNYDSLSLRNQLCFPLYAASRQVIKRYAPYLEELDLTYTQYVAMVLLWEHKTMTVKEMGDVLFLDSGTLTPLLKKLEAKGLITRTRSTEDERNLNVSVTEASLELHKKAFDLIPMMGQCQTLSTEEVLELYKLLYKLIGQEEIPTPDWA